MTHSIKDKYESWWFREGQGKGPSAENKEEEKAKKKIPKKKAFTYSCIYTAGTQTHDRTWQNSVSGWQDSKLLKRLFKIRGWPNCLSRFFY